MPDQHYEKLTKEVLGTVIWINSTMKIFNNLIEPSIPKVSPWLDVAFKEYYANNNKINNYFINNIFKSKSEKEKNYAQIVENLKQSTEKVEQSYIDSEFEIDDNYVKKYNSEYNKIGYNIASSEGSYYFEMHYPYLLKIFGIPNSWKEYLTLKYSGINNFGEAYSKIGTKETIEFINKYEKFIKKHSDFIAINEVREDMNSYLYGYLHGYENDAHFNRETNKIKDEYKQSIEQFLKDYPNFSKYSVVKEYYEKLENNKFKINENISNWLWGELLNHMG